MKRSLANRVNGVVRNLSERRRAPHIAALVRNQCNLLIGYSVAPTSDPAANGEVWLLDRVAPHTSTFIDVGANRGEWSAALLSRAPNAKGLAVDAGSAAIKLLRERALSGLSVMHLAVSDAPGEAEFYEFPDAGESSSFSARGGPDTIRRSVRVTTLDDLIEEAGWQHVDLIKIDAEGWDYRCLLGAERALRTHAVSLVQFEYNAPWVDSGSTLKAAIDYLEGYGYSVAVLRAGRLETYDYARLGEFFQYANFVAFTDHAASWLA
jgi:FkbM family methyltransferase